MSDQPAAPANCAACAFWRRLRENEGVCTRHAPQTSIHPEEAAHWPQTRSWQWCGEGVAAEALSIGAHCAACIYWRHPEGGLHPVNRGDMPMAWWAHAGICARHAPYPVSEPGPRAFWRATQDTDFCAEGLPHSPAERSSATLETIDAAGAWQASGGAVARPPRFRHMRPKTLDRALCGILYSYDT